MSEAILRKGNLYNPLIQKLDNLLLDSDQYDLEITIDGVKKYYRVRYKDSTFKAIEGKPKSFHVHRYNNEPISPEEARSFTITRFFREDFKDKKIFPKTTARTNSDFYAYLQRKRGKKNINNSSLVYSFSLPALGERKKYDVSSYDVEIELANNRYYVVFITERANDFGIQRNSPLFMIYEKKDFQKMKTNLDDIIVDIAIKEDYPLKLLEYVYVSTGRDYKLISEFFNIIDSAKSIESVIENPLVKKLISSNDEVLQELIKYLNGEQDDITYQYNNKKK